MDKKPEGLEMDIFQSKEKNYHSNRIINSRHEYSLVEKKMIYCIINQLDANMKVQEDLFNNMYFKIPVSAFGKDYSFHALKAAIMKIVTRVITGGDDRKEHAFALVPIPWAEVKNGMVELMLQAKAVPYFIDLKKQGYTSYELDIAMSLGSTYSQRLFELLSRFKDTGKWRVDIDNFKFLLGIDKEKIYNSINGNGKIKEKVLEPARRELAEKTDIEFTYSFEKESRKYVAINFNIYTKKLIKHIETADAKADAVSVLEQVAEAPHGQQMMFLHTALSEYQFDEKQKRKILDNQKFTLKFVEIHTLIMTKAIEVQTTPTRLMAWHLRQLGWS